MRRSVTSDGFFSTTFRFLAARLSAAGKQPEGETDVPDRLEPPRRLLLDRMPDDPIDRGGKWIGKLRLGTKDRRHRLDRRAGVERMGPADHLGEEDAKRENVGAGVDRLSADLFRRHVGRGSHRDSGSGLQRRGRDDRIAERLGGVGHFREAEIEELDPAVAREKDILGLEVAVDDAPLVRRCEAVGDLNRHIDGFAKRQRTLFEPLAQGASVEELRDDE
jgi:hypothetical protein